MTSPTSALVIQVYIHPEARWFDVTFEGHEMDRIAADYITRLTDSGHPDQGQYGRYSFHIVQEETTLDVPLPLVWELLYPSCEHSLSALDCYGPGHYLPEQAAL